MRFAPLFVITFACATPLELEHAETREQALSSWGTTLSPGNGTTFLDAPSIAEAGGRLYAVGFPPHTEVRYAEPASTGALPSWNLTTPLPIAIDGAGLVAFNGWLYAFWGGVQTAPDTWEENLNVYRAPIQSDGSLGAWSSSGGLLSTGSPDRLTAFVANGYLYGVTDHEQIQYAKIQNDGSLGTWTLDTSATSDVGTYRGATVYGGYLYTFGGWYSLASSSVYQDLIRVAALGANGSIGPWTTLTTHLPDARSLTAAALVGTTVYLIGGQTAAQYPGTTTVLRVDLAANGGVTSIVADSALPAPWLAVNAAATTTHLYVQGGWRQGNTLMVNQNSYVAALSSSASDAGVTPDDAGSSDGALDGDGNDGDGSGCGCHSAEGASSLLWSLVVFVLLWRRGGRSS